MSKKQKFILSLVLIFIMLFVVSCTMRRPADPNPNDNRQTRFTPRFSPNPRRSPIPRRPIGPNASPSPRTNRNGDMTDRAEEIADAVADEKEIESATCIITGDTAMIGVQFDDQYKGELTDKIKKKVEEVAKRADKDIDRVVVTADPDIVSRIEDIFEDIGEGRPLSGFAREINELLNRIQPK